MHILIAQLSCTLVCLEPTALFWDNIRVTQQSTGRSVLVSLMFRESCDLSVAVFSYLHICTFVSHLSFCIGATVVCVWLVIHDTKSNNC